MNIVIIGGSIAGCITAEVLSRHVEKVTIIEKGDFSMNNLKRDNIPQEEHAHVLLAKGIQYLESIYPDIVDTLVANGAAYSNIGEDIDFMQYDKWKKKYTSKYNTVFCTRRLLDCVIRNKIIKNKKIEIKTHTQVRAFITQNKKNIVGVEVCENNDAYQIPSDLVIDCSGFSSKTSDMLQALGVCKPRVTKIVKNLKYVSRMYKIPSNMLDEYKNTGIINWSSGKDKNSIGILLPIENGGCIVSVGGCFSNIPETNETSYLSFLENLGTKKIYDLVKRLEPISDLNGFNYTGSTWYHYEELKDLPNGLIVLGAALCGINPFYGQGITLTFEQIDILDKNIDKIKLNKDTKSTQKKISSSLKTPWLMGKVEDLRAKELEKENSFLLKILQWYSKKFSLLATDNLVAREIQYEVIHLLYPPTRIFHPKILLKVLNVK